MVQVKPVFYELLLVCHVPMLVKLNIVVKTSIAVETNLITTYYTALARLQHSNCKIWILDEPFTAIDKKGVEELEQLFIQHAESGGCVILTTHQDMSIISDAMLRKITLDYRFV